MKLTEIFAKHPQARIVVAPREVVTHELPPDAWRAWIAAYWETTSDPAPLLVADADFPDQAVTELAETMRENIV